MRFYEQLNQYMKAVNCTAKELCIVSGISAAALSRYRSGERVPDVHSETFEQLCSALETLALKREGTNLTKTEIRQQFLACSDMKSTDKEQLRQNFNTLISVLNLNITKLCQHISYDTSTIFRFRNGSRSPADPEGFVLAVSAYVARKYCQGDDLYVLAQLLECSEEELNDTSVVCEKIRLWLLNSQNRKKGEDSLSKFLSKLDEFDLNEYIKVIHFDEMKVPGVPFQFPTAKYYYGLEEMMASELHFLKATVLSKSKKPVTMYSDMPMTEMAKDPEFPKKWMFGMALLLKKGLHLNQIHQLDRSFEEMMLGLESWIPMYMTGQISPYYLKGEQSNVFHHFLKVSGAAVLSGEAITGHHSEGRYYLSKTKEDIAYYTKRAEALLLNASPLMDIYREDHAGKLNALLLADTSTPGKRRSILSSLPLYTLDSDYLKDFLQKHRLSAKDQASILDFAQNQRDITEKILEHDVIEDEIPLLTEKDFYLHALSLPLSGMFFPDNIPVSYEEYLEQKKQAETFACLHPNYHLTTSSSNPFQNLQIILHEGKWAMISKGNAPAIHFVIHHPKLRNAIEYFIPPVVEAEK